MTDETRIDGEPMNCPKGTIALQSGVSGPTHTDPLTSCTQRRLYGLRTHPWKSWGPFHIASP